MARYEDDRPLLLLLGLAGLLLPMQSRGGVVLQLPASSPPPAPSSGGDLGQGSWQGHFAGGMTTGTNLFPIIGTTDGFTNALSPTDAARLLVARAAYTQAFVTLAIDVDPGGPADSIAVRVWRRAKGGAWADLGEVLLLQGELVEAGTLAIVGGAAQDELTLAVRPTLAVSPGAPFNINVSITLL